MVVHSLRGDAFDASEDGTGRGTPLVCGTLAASGAGTERPAGQGNELDFCVIQDARGMDKEQNGIGVSEGGPAYTLDQQGSQAVAFAQNTRDEVRLFGGDGKTVGALGSEPGMKQQSYVAASSVVRRLTPRECERLQGFPDDYTLIPYRGKPATDGPRYKALGNSWAVPCVRWIGKRIEQVELI